MEELKWVQWIMMYEMRTPKNFPFFPLIIFKMKCFVVLMEIISHRILKGEKNHKGKEKSRKERSERNFLLPL